MVLRFPVAAVLSASLLAAAPAMARYAQTNLAATDSRFGAPIVDPDLIDAWGFAIRPAGFGGHFWVTANVTGTSTEYVGDVGGVPLHQDTLKQVSIPGAGGQPATPTGVVFNSSSNFQITQPYPSGAITNSAKFLFASTDGTLSGWTERATSGGGFDRPTTATTVVDRSSQGSQFFGLGLSQAANQLYVADFGDNPGVRTYNGGFVDLTDSYAFANPFSGPDNYAPFNVQDIVTGGVGSVFVTYASQESPGSEVHGAGLGRLARYDEAGNLLQVADDKGLLNSPWGLAIAPGDFGEYSGDLLVGNFGSGNIVAFDPMTLSAIGYLHNPDGSLVTIDGLWGLVFGNGASLGQANSLYFAAGPADETQGLFGRIDAVPEPAMWAMFFGGLGMIGGMMRRRRATESSLAWS